MYDLGTGVEAIVVWIGDLVDTLRVELTALIRDGPPAAFKELINLAVTDFTAAPVDTSTVPAAESVPTGETVPTGDGTLLDLDILSSSSVLLPVKTGNANAIEKAVAGLNGDVSLSHPSSSHAVTFFFYWER